MRPLALWLAGRLPFHYAWVVLAAVCCAGFARQGPAVATLSIFVEPMTSEYGWSRTAISGAVSLGGVLAAFTSPFLGRILDARGARAVLTIAILTTAAACFGLAFAGSLVVFYLLFCLARMNFAGAFDLGVYGAVANWFVDRRALAVSITTLAHMAGLASLPLIAHMAIDAGGLRAGWLAVGATVLLVGLPPVWLLLVRRPEDMGMVPEAAPNRGDGPPATEPAFTRAQALKLPAFWLLALFTALAYPVQAGVSLHQAPHLIERGLDPTIAASVVGTLSIVSAFVGFALGFWPRRLSLNLALVGTGLALGVSALMMRGVESAAGAYLSGALFGAGIGGLITVLPLAWANYFGRASFGAIRGIALSLQVLSQASGPMISGVLRDLTGDYQLPFACLGAMGLVAAAVAFLARAPRAVSK